jgi:cell division septation protein DedD
MAIIGLFALYKFKPGVFDHLHSTKPAPLELKTPLQHDTVKSVTSGIKVDTGTKKEKVDTQVAPPVEISPASTIDSTKVRFEVVGGNLATLQAANEIVKNYKSRDIDAHVVDTTQGKHGFKVSLGTYSTRTEAVEAINNLKKTEKVKEKIWTLQINPKK